MDSLHWGPVMWRSHNISALWKELKWKGHCDKIFITSWTGCVILTMSGAVSDGNFNIISTIFRGKCCKFGCFSWDYFEVTIYNVPWSYGSHNRCVKSLMMNMRYLWLYDWYLTNFHWNCPEWMPHRHQWKVNIWGCEINREVYNACMQCNTRP